MFAAIALCTLACGPERAFTGVWQQVGCGDAEDVPCEDGYVYELHLGRFGSKVSGLVVRYTWQGDELDNFDKSNECGCFFINSGSARESGVSFALFNPGTPGVPSEDTRPEDRVCRFSSGESKALPELPECRQRRFRLTLEDDDLFVGRLECAGELEQEIRFQRVTGRTREQCVQP